jgi:nitrate/TMAO reductase-like tetraheme cytochrome c subunit
MPKKKKISSVSDAIFGTPSIRTVKNPLNVSFPSLYPSETRKDSRRSFSPTQQKAILHQQDNKCAICHKKLDPRATEFDHEKSWASGGRTIRKNGRALCANCHKITMHETRLKEIDKKRKPRTANPFF